MFLKNRGPLNIKRSPDSWSSQDNYMEWVRTILVPETRPLNNQYGRILLLIDVKKTHLSPKPMSLICMCLISLLVN